MTAIKPKFQIEDVIEHKSTGSQYKIKEFTLETAKLKNLDPKARLQNRQIMFRDLNSRYTRVNGTPTDPNLIGQINRIATAVKFMREDVTKMKADISTMCGNNERSLEHAHNRIGEMSQSVDNLTDLLRDGLGVGE